MDTDSTAAATRHPRVPPFLAEHSQVLRCTLVDDDAAKWRDALPPDLELSKSMELLETVIDLHAELQPAVFRICHGRTQALYEALSARDDADAALLLTLVEYLQLPKMLAARLQQHLEVLRFRALPVETQPRLLHHLRSSALLQPLLNDTIAHVCKLFGGRRSSKVPWTYGTLADCDQFQSGLCGDPPLAVDAAAAAGTGVTGVEAQARCCAGRLLAGHPREPTSAEVKRRDVVSLVAAYTGDLRLLRSVLSDGWMLCPLAMWAAAAQRDLPMLRFVRDAAPGTPWPYLALSALVAGGSVDLLSWALSHGLEWVPSTWLCEAASRGGHLDMLQYLVHVRGVPFPSSEYNVDVNSVLAAATGGHTETVSWLRARGARWNASLFNVAAYTGDIAALEGLWSLPDPPPRDADATYQAGCTGHGDALRWLVEHGWPVRIDVPGVLAERGDLELLQYVREKGAPFTAHTLASAAGRDALAAVRWLRDVGCPWDATACRRAAHSKAAIPMLEFLLGGGCPVDEAACEAAASAGSLEVLQFLRARGVPWGSTTCSCAAAAAALPVLQWARAQNPPCPWDADTIREAVFHEAGEVLAWARANGCPEPEEGV
jgi:hypothetical protein